MFFHIQQRCVVFKALNFAQIRYGRDAGDDVDDDDEMKHYADVRSALLVLRVVAEMALVNAAKRGWHICATNRQL